MRLNRVSGLLRDIISLLENFMGFIQKSRVPLMENYNSILNIIDNQVGHIVDNPFCVEYFE